MKDTIYRQDAIDAMSNALIRVFPEHEKIAKKTIGALPSAQSLDVQIAYYKGLNDGIEQCTERLKRLTDEVRRRNEQS